MDARPVCLKTDFLASAESHLYNKTGRSVYISRPMSMVRIAMTSLDLATPASARERILNAAYELFSRRGIRAVGTDEVIERAGVAKATLYRHFATKNDLVLAVLERREATLDSWLDRGAVATARQHPRGTAAGDLRRHARLVPKPRRLRRLLVHQRAARVGGRIIRPDRPASLISTTSATSCATARSRPG